jgi:hypothetical protein
VSYRDAVRLKRTSRENESLPGVEAEARMLG